MHICAPAASRQSSSNRLVHRQLLLGAVSLFAAALVGCSSSADPSTDSSPRQLGFRFEQMDHPRLKQLLDQEHLDQVVDLEASPFVQILSLKDWVAGQWPAGNPDPYPPWDALTILDWIRSGKTGGFCGQYAQVFLQALASVGIQARYVEIGSVDNPYAHYVTEVWSTDLGKWVLMDPDYNLHFERDGVPLGVLEIHDTLLDGSADRLTVVRGTIREGHSDPNRWPLKTAELYHYVRFHLKANHLSVPNEPPFDRYGDMVEWLDSRVVPWEESTVESPYPKERLTSRATSDRALTDQPPSDVRQ